MVNIIHRIGINATIEKVYQAVSTINGIAGWWTKNTSGISGMGNNIIVQFYSTEGKELGRMNMEVVALEPNKKVEWKFVEGPSEWIGTNATFDLKQEDNLTILLFGHNNWKEAVEFTSHCSMKWAVFLLSLKELVETGKGKPSPKDIKIDNWN
jgi:uncharacterized protein YndB with AHSA1/START domain